jgi:hypothetical protein
VLCHIELLPYVPLTCPFSVLAARGLCRRTGSAYQSYCDHGSPRQRDARQLVRALTVFLGLRRSRFGSSIAPLGLEGAGACGEQARLAGEPDEGSGRPIGRRRQRRAGATGG